ncbi:MAG TPA: hypothetical protein VI757_16430 [Bacteroidia bacterium]|nr:hypothetical protein [Bacteroidia bacterium]
MVHGAWGLVHGAWCVVHGAWCVVLGAWCVVHSLNFIFLFSYQHLFSAC